MGFVQALHDTDDFARGQAYGHADDVPGLVPGPIVDLSVESGVRLRIVSDDGLAGLEDVASEAGIVEYADFSDQIALGDSRIQFTRFRIVQKKRTAVTAECSGSDIDQSMQNAHEIVGGRATRRDFEQGLCATQGKRFGKFLLARGFAFLRFDVHLRFSSSSRSNLICSTKKFRSSAKADS